MAQRLTIFAKNLRKVPTENNRGTNLRITNEEHQAISNTIHKVDAESIIYLFGSRVNEEALGGYIDLLVLAKKISRAVRPPKTETSIGISESRLINPAITAFLTHGVSTAISGEATSVPTLVKTQRELPEKIYLGFLKFYG